MRRWLRTLAPAERERGRECEGEREGVCVCVIERERGCVSERERVREQRRSALQHLPRGLKGSCKATWEKEFKLPWREAGPPNYHDDIVEWDQ